MNEDGAIDFELLMRLERSSARIEQQLTNLHEDVEALSEKLGQHDERLKAVEECRSRVLQHLIDTQGDHSILAQARVLWRFTLMVLVSIGGILATVSASFSIADFLAHNWNKFFK